jgi:hypothetical protein
MKATTRVTTGATTMTRVILAVVVAAAAMFPRATAQVVQPRQNVVPAYEGWEANLDGSFNLVVGYLNRSWEEQFHVTIGPNSIEPGGPDQGQPAFFSETQQVRIPRSCSWAISATKNWSGRHHRGKTDGHTALKPDYVLDDIVIMLIAARAERSALLLTW